MLDEFSAQCVKQQYAGQDKRSNGQFGRVRNDWPGLDEYRSCRNAEEAEGAIG